MHLYLLPLSQSVLICPRRNILICAAPVHEYHVLHNFLTMTRPQIVFFLMMICLILGSIRAENEKIEAELTRSLQGKSPIWWLVGAAFSTVMLGVYSWRRTWTWPISPIGEIAGKINHMEPLIMKRNNNKRTVVRSVCDFWLNEAQQEYEEIGNLCDRSLIFGLKCLLDTNLEKIAHITALDFSCFHKLCHLNQAEK